jgi:hypothetical protein
MVLRGALNRGLNVAVGAAVILGCCVALYLEYAHGVIGGKELLADCFVFLLGVATGLPAYRMNRRALSELYDQLIGKIFLSSQLALLDSRHGKNALGYFYLVAYGVRVGALFGGALGALSGGALGGIFGHPAYPHLVLTVWGFFVCGEYLSAHVLPFVFAPKRQVG